ncbi:MAG: hypothetical protein IJ566_01745 [Cardiobacteriaceae bacterium]|nr:hypothetical protein [Cardiobacteriaceae bacterium]
MGILAHQNHRHFERSEKSYRRSFASLRMTAAVFGGFTVIFRGKRKISPLPSF